MVEWPSGLRRQVKALISSGARVRIPSQPKFHRDVVLSIINILYNTTDNTICLFLVRK